jgi:RNA polymerase sigma factor (sigma-70 family)
MKLMNKFLLATRDWGRATGQERGMHVASSLEFASVRGDMGRCKDVSALLAKSSNHASGYRSDSALLNCPDDSLIKEDKEDMTPPSGKSALTQGTHAQFHETHWTIVLQAVGSSSPTAADALARLCRTYWYPLYAFARRSGLSQPDAADVTQAFFERLLEKEALQKVDRSKGKFRSFLLAGLKNFMHNRWDKENAQKRGGACQVFSLDELDAEERYLHEPADQTSPEQLYDVQWSVALVNQVIEELRADYGKAGKAELFEALQPYLTGEVPDGRLSEIATRFGLKLSTLKSTLHRLRQDEFGERLREQVSHTLANPTEQDIREEIRHLFAVFSR